jgi:hypothetical protein
MNRLRQIIKEQLLLEKKIGTLLTNIEVTYSFELDRSPHAYDRRTRTDIQDYNTKEISNAEVKYIIELARKKIAESIALSEIKNNDYFVIKSPEKEMAIAIKAISESGSYWKLLIITVFRESYDNPFRVGEDQLVIWV